MGNISYNTGVLKPCTFMLTEDLDQFLHEEAKKRKMSMSAILRWLILTYKEQPRLTVENMEDK